MKKAFIWRFVIVVVCVFACVVLWVYVFAFAAGQTLYLFYNLEIAISECVRVRTWEKYIHSNMYIYLRHVYCTRTVAKLQIIAWCVILWNCKQTIYSNVIYFIWAPTITGMVWMGVLSQCLCAHTLHYNKFTSPINMDGQIIYMFGIATSSRKILAEYDSDPIQAMVQTHTPSMKGKSLLH